MESLASRPSRSMAIDSLLNPQAAESEKPSSKLHYGPGPLTPQYSPLYPPSPNQYYYSFSESQQLHHNQHLHHHHHHHHHHHSPYSQHTPSSQDHHSFMSYRPRSTDSSPEAYPRDRYDSVSSSSSTNNGASGDRRRPPRPKYEEEEMYFIWYHRVDLCQEWKEVRESFNRQFPSRQRRGFQGIQCKFYRFIKEKKCPTLREQRRMRDGEFLRQESSPSFNGGAPQFGVVEWMGVWYPWMREDREEVMRRRLSR
ncbi:hypothetical protein ASPSYDRAFT_152978 [Aspergillus sydowii CBS 593.65]|uniref:Uncharacterized protein n=1 Tax=Aspergillus sydowii CBS 593.65 TaxID=1036612 RepID=A0A1L9TEQ7_9EURO|nr:uncharacterized protein ASPSYDRAFT_152978 [Aspergillus sydowii CBS 593.65]OJJ57861.1 hypothetical protein ASPSYDRAFT_152978 [Aspergillus sydowii CBS 593.65]